MDAFCIVLDDLVLGAGVFRCRLLPLAMAFRAESGYVRWERRRVWAELPEHCMGAMTFLARRPVRIALADKFPVCADLKLLTDLGMAGGTIHLLGDRLTRPEVRHTDLRVTLTA